MKVSNIPAMFLQRLHKESWRLEQWIELLVKSQWRRDKLVKNTEKKKTCSASEGKHLKQILENMLCTNI